MFINWSQSIGQILTAGTQNTTGSMFLTLLLIFILLLAVCLMFGIELEYTAILVLPLGLAYMSYYSDFLKMGAVLLFYLGFVFTNKFIFK